jgi:hypothetical protein
MNNTATVTSTEVSKLEEHSKLSEVVAKVNELVELMNKRRDRGPESTKAMTEEDARRVCLGDLAGSSHTKAAEAAGLSYGQVYSARKGFTFKAVYKEAVTAGKIKE